MKTRIDELNVDFIGDPKGLTPIEEKALSDYFKQKKAINKSKVKVKKVKSKS